MHLRSIAAGNSTLEPSSSCRYGFWHIEHLVPHRIGDQRLRLTNRLRTSNSKGRCPTIGACSMPRSPGWVWRTYLRTRSSPTPHVDAQVAYYGGATSSDPLRSIRACERIEVNMNEFSTSIVCYRPQAAFFVVLADGLVREGFPEFPLRQRVKAPGDY
jgi:hypothetical protein